MRRPAPSWITLDETDWAILRALGREARIPNIELSRRIGLSPAPTLRRVKALEAAGFILGYHARLNDRLLGFEVSAFIIVTLGSQSQADRTAFEAKLRAWDVVREAHLISGEGDFMLRCAAPDMQAFQAFLLRDLTPTPNVEGVKVAITLGTAKDEPLPPV